MKEEVNPALTLSQSSVPEACERHQMVMNGKVVESSSTGGRVAQKEVRACLKRSVYGMVEYGTMVPLSRGDRNWPFELSGLSALR